MLIKCPECGNPISSKAVACPHCGYPLGSDENIKYEPYIKETPVKIIDHVPVETHTLVFNKPPEESSAIYKPNVPPVDTSEEHPQKSTGGIISISIAALLGLAYLCYSAYYWTGVISETNTVQNVAKNSWDAIGSQLGVGIATTLVTPHLVCSGIAVLFNCIAALIRKRWAALTAAIMYSVAIILFPMYFMFVTLQAILCFVAFARMPKQ